MKFSLITKVALVFLLTCVSNSGISCFGQTNIISTIAGTGTLGYLGDGGPATDATMLPTFCMLDSSGNLFFSDVGYRIRKISSGIITRTAGVTSTGFGGDGGPATAATFGTITGFAMDRGGNIYVADGTNNRVRKINTAGVITTIVGSSTWGFSGDGGPATAALLNYPINVETDTAGNIYIADRFNYRIRKIDAAGTITTIAGTGISAFSGDGGPAAAASFVKPSSLTISPSGALYIIDDISRIRKIDEAGIITTIAGSDTIGYAGDGGPATAALINARQLAVSSLGVVYIADLGSSIRKINALGTITTIVGNGTGGFAGDGGPATAALLNRAAGIAVDTIGNVFIGDYSNYRVRKITANNHAPIFTGGDIQHLNVCMDRATALDTLLTVADIDTPQDEIWRLMTRPLHGSVPVVHYVPSTGDTLIPTGLYYTPASGYTGADTFIVRIDDGIFARTTTIYVTINPIPDAGTIIGTDSLCYGSSVSLANAATGGTWSMAGTNAAISATGIVTTLIPGLDTVQYIVTAAGCSDTALLPVRVISPDDCVTGVGTASLTLPTIFVYPQPSNGQFTVSIPKHWGAAKLVVTDITGRKLKEVTVTGTGSLQIDGPTGMYLLTAWTPEGRKDIKVTIVK